MSHIGDSTRERERESMITDVCAQPDLDAMRMGSSGSERLMRHQQRQLKTRAVLLSLN